MAQASFVIAAVDKTQQAINSATRGMKTLEKTAKITGKAINLSFGLLTGAALTSAFKGILEAAKKTNEGAQAIDRMNKALKDPALVAAANTFTSAVVNGFSAVVEFATKAIKEVSKFGQQIGLISKSAPKPQSSSSMGSRFGRVYKSTATEEDLTQAYSAILQSRLNVKEPKTESVKVNKKKSDDFITSFRKMAEQANEEARKYAESQKELSDRLQENVIKSMKDYTINLDEIILDSNVAEIFKDRLGMMQDFVQSAAIQMRDAFADFLFNPFENGLRGMLVGFMNTIRRMIAELVAKQALLAFFGMFTGGTGVVSQIANAAIDAIGTRASGGPVSANTPYLVGERGPELFMPSSSGSIVPNHKMGGGVTISPVYNIDARGATADLQAALPSILKENNRRIFDELDRRYGIGR